MPSIKITPSHFQGSGRVFTRESNGLANILRSMLTDTARLKVEVSAVPDFTDNSTGVAASAFAALPSLGAAIDATTAGGVTTASFNVATVKFQNAGKVISNSISVALTLLGLPVTASATGTQVAADTIPALDKIGVAGNGTAAVSLASAVAAATVANANLARLGNGVNAVFAAIGAPVLSETVFGPHALDLTLIAIPSGVSVAAGPGAVSKTAVDAYFTAYANNIATIAAKWNAAMDQGTPGAGALRVVAG